MSANALSDYVRSALVPLVAAIDEEGHYPEAFLRGLGALNGFVAPEDLARQLEITTLVARYCGSTAFLVWCQSTCAWYLEHAPNDAVRERYLDSVVRGELLAGTGMSNPVKHLAGIEKIQLVARREGEGYRLDGTLPWVSNVGPRHIAMVAAAVENAGYGMFTVRCGAEGLELLDCPAFSGMEGTQTKSLKFREYRVDAQDVIAHPQQFAAFIERIKPGFVLGQAAMGFGIVQGSLRDIRAANAARAQINSLLDDQAPALAEELAALEAQAHELAPAAQAGTAAVVLPVLRLRARVSELALRATQSAALHAGAQGYLMSHPAQRRLREALFVAIVTPALKHLRKEIRDLERIEAEAA